MFLSPTCAAIPAPGRWEAELLFPRAQSTVPYPSEPHREVSTSVQGSSALISQVSGLRSLVLVLIPGAGTYRFTDRLQMKGLQLLGHFLVPLTVPAIKVGGLEETPAESEVPLRRGQRGIQSSTLALFHADSPSHCSRHRCERKRHSDSQWH